MCADQPDIFLQRVLKQTRAYLAQRGEESARRVDEGLKDASKEALIAEQASGNSVRRDVDL